MMDKFTNVNPLTAMKQAREALKESFHSVSTDYHYNLSHGADIPKNVLAAKREVLRKHNSATEALDAAIAQAERAEPVAHSDQYWLHRIDMEKTAAWQQGYAQGLHRAAPVAAIAQELPEWPCTCDERGIGEPGVTYGDCPRDYGHRVTRTITEDDLLAMLPEPRVLRPITDADGFRYTDERYWDERQTLDYGRAVARKYGGMK